MLSYTAIGLAQEGQWDAGHTTDSCLGRRWIQTLRKLPTIAPKKNAMRYGTMEAMPALADLRNAPFDPQASVHVSGARATTRKYRMLPFT